MALMDPYTAKRGIGSSRKHADLEFEEIARSFSSEKLIIRDLQRSSTIAANRHAPIPVKDGVWAYNVATTEIRRIDIPERAHAHAGVVYTVDSVAQSATLPLVQRRIWLFLVVLALAVGIFLGASLFTETWLKPLTLMMSAGLVIVLALSTYLAHPPKKQKF